MEGPSCWSLSLLCVATILASAIQAQPMELSLSQKELIVKIHNSERRNTNPEAANMRGIEWDSNLEQQARDWAKLCKYRQPPTEMNVSANYYYKSQTNLSDSSQSLFVRTAVKHWASHKRRFRYTTDCGLACPYVKMIYAVTETVGCAINTCQSMFLAGQEILFLTCLYPSLDLRDHLPYQFGKPCSLCPEGWNCTNRLCLEGENSSNGLEDLISPKVQDGARWRSHSSRRYSLKVRNTSHKKNQPVKEIWRRREEQPGDQLPASQKLPDGRSQPMQGSRQSLKSWQTREVAPDPPKIQIRQSWQTPRPTRSQLSFLGEPGFRQSPRALKERPSRRIGLSTRSQRNQHNKIMNEGSGHLGQGQSDSPPQRTRQPEDYDQPARKNAIPGYRGYNGIFGGQLRRPGDLTSQNYWKPYQMCNGQYAYPAPLNDDANGHYDWARQPYVFPQYPPYQPCNIMGNFYQSCQPMYNPYGGDMVHPQYGFMPYGCQLPCQRMAPSSSVRPTPLRPDSLTDMEKRVLVEVHNNLRRQRRLKSLSWDDHLEQWSNYVIRCGADYPGPANTYTNFALGPPQYQARSVIYDWMRYGYEPQKQELQQQLRNAPPCRSPGNRRSCTPLSNIVQSDISQMGCTALMCNNYRKIICIYGTQ